MLVRKSVGPKEVQCVLHVFLRRVQHIVAWHETIGVHLYQKHAPPGIDNEVGREKEEAAEIGSLLQKLPVVRQRLFSRQQHYKRDDPFHLREQRSAHPEATCARLLQRVA